MEAFDVGMINYSKYLEKKGLIEAPFYFNLFLGNITCAQADMLNAGLMINSLPDKSIWSLAGIGTNQLKINALSIAVGGGVRFGIEDNIWYDLKKTKLAKNIDLLVRIHTIEDKNERKIMTSLEFRKLMNLKDGKNFYGR